jgi:aminopeptidase YwaD
MMNMAAHLSRKMMIVSWLLLGSMALGCQAARSHDDRESHPTSASAQAAPAAPPQAPPAPAAPSAERNGSVTSAPRDIRQFSPKESLIETTVAAGQLDLRKVFDDLGPDATLWYQHVQTLANPFFEGRAPGTRGGDLAVEYLEFYFRQYGLEPAFPDETTTMGGEAVKAFTSYRQPFDFASPNPDVRIIEAAASIKGEPLKEESEFVVLGNSATGKADGPITFVGYGIAAGRDGYTSFEPNTDLTGRIALLFRYEPLDESGKSKWSQARFSQMSGVASKMRSVAERGAAGIIMVNPPGAVDGKTGLETVRESARFGRRLEIPVVQVTPEVAQRLLSAGDPEKRDLMTWRTLADNGEIKTFNLDDSIHVTINADLEVNDRLKTENVAAVLRGKGSLADEWVVIGAHYDHVGFGYTGAMPANVGQLHPGADDNASGTAAVLIAAKRLSEKYAKAASGENLRSILFMGFGAEEAGLHGSRYFVEHSPISMGAINLMINMDMVGRLRSDSLLIQGTGTADNFPALLKPIFEQSGLKISASPTGRGPSDHSSFYGKQVPVLFLFTGEHADYHKPGDLAHTVNPAGAVKVIDLLEALTRTFATRVERLSYASAVGAGPGRDTGARVSLGTIPDYTAELETGMRVDDVREASSAAEAGIKPGDILLTWNGEEIVGARKLSELLAKHEPGDRVTIVLRRGDQELTINVHLKSRIAQ